MARWRASLPTRLRGARALVLAACACALASARRAAGVSSSDCPPAASVTTPAGAGVAGYRDSAFGGEAALLSSPRGVALRPAGDVLYVADAGNNRVRVAVLPANATAEGMSAPTELYGLAGNGAAGASDDDDALQATFSAPADVAVIAAGDLLVADTGNSLVRRVAVAAGSSPPAAAGVTTFAGHGIAGLFDSPDPLAAMFNAPEGIAHDAATNVTYVADTGNNAVRAISWDAAAGARGAAGAVTLLAGSSAGQAGFADSMGGDTDGSGARFDAPRGLALGLEGAVLYVADTGNGAVRAIDTVTGVVSTLVNPPGSSPAAVNGLVQHPTGVAFDPAVGLYVSDRIGDIVVLVGTDPDVDEDTAAAEAEAAAAAATPAAVTMGVYGVPRPVAGARAGGDGLRDGVGDEARLHRPAGLAVGAAGTPFAGVVFVADELAHAVRRLDVEAPVALTVKVTGVGDFDNHTGVDGANTRPGRHQDQYEAGYYAINGPPHNETNHVYDHITYHGEEHELTLCTYPSQSTFVYFRGRVAATVTDEAGGHVYLAWEGASAQDSRSETLRLRGSGCADEDAANYNPYATSHVASKCVAGHKATLVVRASGATGGAYQIDGPAFFHFDELEGLADSADEDEVHEITLSYYPGASYTFLLRGQVNASLHSPSGAWGEYLGWAGNASSDRVLLSFRPPGPGCTDAAASNYNALALHNDGSCISGSDVDVSVSATNASRVGYRAQHSAEDAAPPDWFARGAFTVIHAGTAAEVALSHLFEEGDGLSGGGDTAGGGDGGAQAQEVTRRVRLPPGRYELTFFGQVSGEATDAASGSPLVSFDGALELTLYVDENGFARTLEEGAVLFRVAVDPTNPVPVTDAGGHVGQVDVDAGAVVVPEGAIEEGEVVDITLGGIDADGAHVPSYETLKAEFGGREMYPIGQIFRFLPHGQKFLKPVTIQVPFDVRSGLAGACGTAAGVPCEHALTFVRASDEAADNWRVMAGGSFKDGVGTLDVDTFSLVAIVLRARVDALVPTHGGSATGGAMITVVGSQFHESSFTFCRFSGGALPTRGVHTKAEVISERRMACAVPRGAAGFVTVEYMQARTLMVSNTSTQVLVHSPPRLAAVTPRGGGRDGGTLATLRGADLHAYAAGSSHGGHMRAACEVGPARGGGGSRGGGVRTSVARMLSSVLAVCEIPDARSAGVEIDVGGSAVDAEHGLAAARVALVRGESRVARERTFGFAQPGLETAEMQGNSFVHSPAHDEAATIVQASAAGAGPGALLAMRDYCFAGIGGFAAKDASAGSVGGGSSVLVSGESTCSPMSASCRCTFGTVSVGALPSIPHGANGIYGDGGAWQHVQCVSPSGAAGSQVPVTVGASASAEASTPLGTFAYDPPQTTAGRAQSSSDDSIIGTSALAADARGGEAVTVYGGALSTAGSALSLGCAFGIAAVSAAARATSGAVCLIPAHPAGFVPLRVVSLSSGTHSRGSAHAQKLAAAQLSVVETPWVRDFDRAVRLAGGGGVLAIHGAHLQSPARPLACEWESGGGGRAVGKSALGTALGVASASAGGAAGMGHLRAVSSVLAACVIPEAEESVLGSDPSDWGAAGEAQVPQELSLAAMLVPAAGGGAGVAEGPSAGATGSGPSVRVSFVAGADAEAIVVEAGPEDGAGEGLPADGGAVVSVVMPSAARGSARAPSLVAEATSGGRGVQGALDTARHASIVCDFGTVVGVHAAPMSAAPASLGRGVGTVACVAPARAAGVAQLSLRAATASLAAGSRQLRAPNVGYDSRIGGASVGPAPGAVAMPESMPSGGSGVLIVSLEGVPPQRQWRPPAQLLCSFAGRRGDASATAQLVRAAATGVGGGSAACLAPPLQAGFAVVTVTTAPGASVRAGSDAFVVAAVHVREPEVVRALLPAIGPARGGVVVHAVGANMHEGARARCAFGAHAPSSDGGGGSSAYAFSSALLACEVPPASAAGARIAAGAQQQLAAVATVPMSVISDHSRVPAGAHALPHAHASAAAGPQFAYALQPVRDVQVHSSHRRGGQTSGAIGSARGGTSVVLAGEGFSAYVVSDHFGGEFTPGCAFGTVYVAARAANASALECVSPARAAGAASLAVVAHAAAHSLSEGLADTFVYT